MPYVVKAVREDVADGMYPNTPGTLNYAFTRAIVQYLRVAGLTYSSINDVVGALEGAKAEFQRRVVAPYEDDCIALNGDVYPKGFTSGRPNKGVPSGARF